MKDAPSHLSDYSPPGGRLPPPEVVRGLREVDPLAELVYIGDGRWLLGKVQEDREKRVRAVRAMDAWNRLITKFDPTDHELTLNQLLPGLYDRWNEKRLQLQGFQPLPVVFFMEMPDSSIVELFRRADWIWKFSWRQFEADLEEEIDGTSDLNMRREEMKERFDQTYKSVWRHAFKKPTMRTNTVDIGPDGAIQRPA